MLCIATGKRLPLKCIGKVVDSIARAFDVLPDGSIRDGTRIDASRLMCDVLRRTKDNANDERGTYACWLRFAALETDRDRNRTIWEVFCYLRCPIGSIHYARAQDRSYDLYSDINKSFDLQHSLV